MSIGIRRGHTDVIAQYEPCGIEKLTNFNWAAGHRKAAAKACSCEPRADPNRTVLAPTGGRATIAAIMKPTGWQRHSVHGSFAGVVHWPLSLALFPDKKDGARFYRIPDSNPGKTKSATAQAQAHAD